MNKSINEYFREFIEFHYLLKDEAKVLIAVSGGVDSMVLLDLFRQSNCDIGVATINYALRAHADVEAQCVKDYCEQHNIPFHFKVAAQAEREELKASNLQEKARNLRYAFFQKIQNEHGYTHLATAHHADDVVESFFLSLKRGAGIKGLSPMTEKNEHLLRPLLHFSKKEIINYADAEGIPYENDESNLTDDYDRNFIRNKVLPLLENRFSDFKKSVLKSSENIASSSKLLAELIDDKQQLFIHHEENRISVTLSEVQKFQSQSTLLYHLISEYNFNHTQCTEILKSQQNGALWESTSHRATLSDNSLIIEKNTDQHLTITLEGEGEYLLPNGHSLEITKVKMPRFEKSKNIEYVDADKLQFPLKLRVWQPGDKMKPLGMNGQSKKVQDILTDAKIDRLTKEKCLVLTSADKIVWLVNFRLDERFKMRKDSKRYHRLEYKSG